MHTRVIAIVNQKGGTGKTTTAVNLAAGLARGLRNGRRTLLVDLDPQANATRVLMGEQFIRTAQGRSVYEALFADDSFDVAGCIHPIALPAVPTSSIPAGKLDLMPSHSRMAAAEIELVVTSFQREHRLQRALAPLLPRYAFVLIDCPPVLGQLTINALMATTEVLIPVDPGLFSLDGLVWLRKTIQMARQANPRLRVMGVVPTLTENTVVSRDTVGALKQMFGEEMLLPAIPRRTALREAQVHEQDIFAFAPQNAGAQAYKALIREVLKRGPENDAAGRTN
jgi:chromosome partitioning protein